MMKSFLSAVLAGYALVLGLSPARGQSSGPTTSTGTAFAVVDGQTYATNYHVVEGARTICLRNAQGTLVPAAVLAVDKADDLALLRSELRSPPLPLASATEIQRGMSVLTIGYPHPTVMGLESKVTDGIVNSLTGIRGDQRRFQISTPIQPGNSGGPLLSDRGNVLGVVVSKLGMRFAEVSGDLPNNVGYAIHAARLRALTETTPDLRNAAGPSVGLRPKERVLLVSQAEKSVVLVLASSDREDCAAPPKLEPRNEAVMPRPNQPPSTGSGPSAQERRRQADAEQARLEEEERRRKEAKEAEDRAQDERRRREDRQASIARGLQMIAANWREIPGSLGLAIWRQSQPTADFRDFDPNNLAEIDIESVRHLRDFLQALIGRQIEKGSALPIGAAELRDLGVVKSCGRVERVFQEGNYFIAQSVGTNSLVVGFVQTNVGWRSFSVEKRTGSRFSSLLPQGAAHITLGTEVLSSRCD
jgi:hypothetical protein